MYANYLYNVRVFIGVGTGGHRGASPPLNIKSGGLEYVSVHNIWVILRDKPRHRCCVPIEN